MIVMLLMAVEREAEQQLIRESMVLWISPFIVQTKAYVHNCQASFK
jgi:hypothetical protein